MGTTWNYRVIKTSAGFVIKEVYYNKDGTIYGTTENEIAPYGETLKKLKKDWLLMGGAFEHPIIEEAELEFSDGGDADETLEAD